MRQVPIRFLFLDEFQYIKANNLNNIDDIAYKEKQLQDHIKGLSYKEENYMNAYEYKMNI